MNDEREAAVVRARKEHHKQKGEQKQGLRKEGCQKASEVWRPKRREEEEEDQIGSLGQTMLGSEATAQI